MMDRAVPRAPWNPTGYELGWNAGAPRMRASSHANRNRAGSIKQRNGPHAKPGLVSDLDRHTSCSSRVAVGGTA
jgi:hypothetical protein